MPSTLFITTPCLDVIKTIDRTVLSVVTQSGDFFIRYHVQDGGSRDGTVERLAWWQRRLSSRSFPVQCLGIAFTFASESDSGMYDAVCKGFSAMQAGPDRFMTWINGDDTLEPGALAFITSVERQFSTAQVSWVGGSVSIQRGDMPVSAFDSPIPKEALKAGLCDGVHWSFLQQEGTFFRKWLWDAVDPGNTVAPMKLAGDWNLWRLFAARASLVQTKFKLASFRIEKDQLSARLREKYMAEIDSVLPEAERRRALERLGAPGADVTRRVFKVAYKDGRLTVLDEGRNKQVSWHYHKVFNSYPKVADNSAETRTVHEGKIAELGTDRTLEEIVTHDANILAYDHDWQFPAITEQHAFHRVRASGGAPAGVTYVAYPWANLIDKLQTRAPDAHIHLSRFREFAGRLPRDTVRVTVCQHIKMRDYLYLFETCGIGHIFWSHATKSDTAISAEEGVRIHPFPLYPVQVTEAAEAAGERPYLFSFIGAKSNDYYLTRAREWILERLADHPRGLIVGRDTWHYNKVVYQHQIRPDLNKEDTKSSLVDQPASEQFKASLAGSIFALCPSGSGPNSIRLWEALGAGAIPVILADTYAPPENAGLWDAGAVFCEETPEAIEALPARLEAIAADPDRLAAMRAAGRQLWLLYGPQSFVYDIRKLFLEDPGASELQDSVDPGAVPLRDRLAKALNGTDGLSQKDAMLFLRTCSSDLLLEGPALLKRLEDESAPLGEMAAFAAETLPETHPTLRHFRKVCAHVSQRPGPARTGLPHPARPQAVKICLFGRHANRTPLSYPPLRRAAGDRIELVEDPGQADVLMTGFNLDIRENAEQIERIAQDRPDTRLAVVSEEPLWDSIWSGGFLERERRQTCGATDIGYTFLNHSNSTIFDFETIPYFLLTDDRLLARYSLLLARYAELSPQALLTGWRQAPMPAAFVAEVRDDERYAQSFPAEGVIGLSTYRTEVARNSVMPGVFREGRGWNGNARRQDLPDWHLDKLAKLDRRVRVMSAYENTHQKNYISEKIFDAFALGAIPAYYADGDHGIHRLVPEACMVNTFGETAEAAAERIGTCTPDVEMAERWLDTARRLQDLFSDQEKIRAERQRVTDAVLTALGALHPMKRTLSGELAVEPG